MAARRRRSARDRRRRTHGQNLLVDRGVVARLIARLEPFDGELVVDIGAGSGALTIPLAQAGAKVLAIERDRRLVADLQRAVERGSLGSRVQLRRADLRSTPWPRGPYRVVASPPYGLTTRLLELLLDDPAQGPVRADLLLQHEVARKLATQPAASLRAASWSPWWEFELGERVPRDAFRPVPSVDSSWLTIHRRDPPLLPPRLSRDYREALRPLWQGKAE